MKTILVIDDIIEVLDLIKETLSIDDYLIIPVRTGQEAIGVITKIVPDLIILDWHLGERDNLSGLDTCKAICEMYPHIPILVLSGMAGRNDISDIFSTCDCVIKFMAKPYSPMALLEVITRMLQHGK